MPSTGLRVAVASFFVLLTAQTSAFAIDRHERVEVKEIKEKGEVVGLRVKLTLIKEQAYTRVRVGLAPTNGAQVRSTGDNWRKAGSDPSAGHLLHQFPEIDMSKVERNKPHEVTVELRYKDTPNVQPGTPFELVSAFNGRTDFPNHWHLYGMSSPLNATGSPTYTAPGKSAARTTAVENVRRAGASKGPATHRPRPKAKAKAKTGKRAPRTR